MATRQDLNYRRGIIVSLAVALPLSIYLASGSVKTFVAVMAASFVGAGLCLLGISAIFPKK
jgi:hypothetical protein